jgi:hypothetical protein
MKRLFAIWLWLALPLAGQVMHYTSLHLENGALIIYQTFSEVAIKDQEKAFGTVTASGNVIRRTMLDAKGQAWLGFELHIERKPGPDPIRFLLSMEPLGGSGFFGQKASPREIENGDRILLDVLEEPGTGRKVFDMFQVGVDVPLQGMPLSRSVPHVPTEGAAMHLADPKFMNGLKVFAQATNTVDGPDLAITVPQRGRFTFSTKPRLGFRMEGIADGPRLMFVVGSDLFNVFCAAPIFTEKGSWYVWVRRELPTGPAGVPNLDLTVQ